MATNKKPGKWKKRTLAVRAEYGRVFSQGDYQPLAVLGEHAGHVLAFMRSTSTQRAIVIVPRQASRLLVHAHLPWVQASVWGNTRVKLPFAAPGRKLKGLFSICAVAPHSELMIGAALGDFPVNLFIQT